MASFSTFLISLSSLLPYNNEPVQHHCLVRDDATSTAASTRALVTVQVSSCGMVLSAASTAWEAVRATSGDHAYTPWTSDW